MNTSVKIDNLSEHGSGSIDTNSNIRTGASGNTLNAGESSIDRIKRLQEYYIEVGSDAETTIDNCLEKISSYEATVTKLNEDSLKLQNGIISCKAEITKRGNLIKEKNSEIQKLKADLTSANSKKSELEKKLEDTQVLSEKTASDLKEQISKLTATILSLDSQIASKGNEVVSITTEKNNLEQQLNESEQELGEIKKELESTKELLQIAQGELREINGFIDKMHSGAQKLNAKVNAAKEVLKQNEIKPIEIAKGLLDFNFDDI